MPVLDEAAAEVRALRAHANEIDEYVEKANEDFDELLEDTEALMQDRLEIKKAFNDMENQYYIMETAVHDNELRLVELRADLQVLLDTRDYMHQEIQYRHRGKAQLETEVGNLQVMAEALAEAIDAVEDGDEASYYTPRSRAESPTETDARLNAVNQRLEALLAEGRAALAAPIPFMTTPPVSMSFVRSPESYLHQETGRDQPAASGQPQTTQAFRSFSYDADDEEQLNVGDRQAACADRSNNRTIRRQRSMPEDLYDSDDDGVDWDFVRGFFRQYSEHPNYPFNG
jgi:predicted  nucleic acid-binding Zn-ribbon protein